MISVFTQLKRAGRGRQVACTFAVCTFIIAVMLCESASGIAIRPFKRNSKVNGLNCSTETAFATYGCYCRLNGQRCLGNLKCVNNVCICPTTSFVLIAATNTCVPANVIEFDCAGRPPVGFTTCNIIQPQQNIPGVVLTAPRPNACSVQLTAVASPPTNFPSYLITYPDFFNTFIGVDPFTGQVYYQADPNGNYPCGPCSGCEALAATVTEALVYTYAIQCIDSRGIVSNTVTLNVTFPPCTAAPTAFADCPISGSPATP